jgi:hypothetical protein
VQRQNFNLVPAPQLYQHPPRLGKRQSGRFPQKPNRGFFILQAEDNVAAEAVDQWPALRGGIGCRGEHAYPVLLAV